ncbi:MAG: hypothetical protein ACRDHP_13850 [Ktedonobacterales bacterium]
MGKYMTDDQIKKAKEELEIVYAMPYATTLVGPAWEQILADLKGGMQRSGGKGDSDRWLRDNRAKPDIIVFRDGDEVNYSLKTEALRTTKARPRAADFLGYHEDIIVARPKVDDLLGDRAINTLTPDELGALVLRYYHEQIVVRYQWHVIAFLLRLETHTPYEFIYWDEQPPTVYDPNDYWWKDSGKATGTNRNVNGYPRTVSPDITPLPAAKFKFTSGGKQFYVRYIIPLDADTWTIPKASLTEQEVREALRVLLRREKRTSGDEAVT